MPNITDRRVAPKGTVYQIGTADLTDDQVVETIDLLADHSEPVTEPERPTPQSVLVGLPPANSFKDQLNANGLICPSCREIGCMGKIPGAECETSETDHGAWRGHLVNPLSRLAPSSS